MERSEQINELATALAKAQAKFTNVNKSKTVKIRTKAGGEYTYKYADLADIIEMIRIPMAENGLTYPQMAITIEGKLVVDTMILHSSGQYMLSRLTPPVAPADDVMKAMGGNITYSRRYALSAMLGIASDEDTDGTPGAEKKTTAKPDFKPSTPKAGTTGKFEK